MAFDMGNTAQVDALHSCDGRAHMDANLVARAASTQEAGPPEEASSETVKD